MENGLTIDFCGELYELAPGEELTFGRQADLVVDDENRFMHRRVGRFRFAGATWWLDNLGPMIKVEVDHSTGAHMTLERRGPDHPAPTVALLPPHFTVTFQAGGFRYELLGAVEGAHPSEEGLDDEDGFEDTLRFGHIRLTPDELAMVQALAAPVLADPKAGPDSLPLNSTVAAALGWGSVKYNRKLDHLCRRLDKAGVRGLVGRRGDKAENRRWVLVRHLVDTGQLHDVSPRASEPPA